eukprot:4416409-Prymnesium_polylepis.1
MRSGADRRYRLSRRLPRCGVRAPPQAPRCCVPAHGCVASRAILAATLHAASCWPRHALTVATPCAQAPTVGAAA